MIKVTTNEVLRITKQDERGGAGYIRLPRDNRTGFTKASIMWSTEGGWEHVSVKPLNGSMPKWSDMCIVKDLFWGSDEWVVEYHPAKSADNPRCNCRHLFKPTDVKLPVPPSMLVGLKGACK